MIDRTGKIGRYFLFAFWNYYPEGFPNDLYGTSDDLEELYQFVREHTKTGELSNKLTYDQMIIWDSITRDEIYTPMDEK